MDSQAKVLAFALLEIRHRVSGHRVILCSLCHPDDSPEPGPAFERCVSKAAHLAYALHNEAEAVWANQGFDLAQATARLQQLKRLIAAPRVKGRNLPRREVRFAWGYPQGVRPTGPSPARSRVMATPRMHRGGLQKIAGAAGRAPKPHPGGRRLRSKAQAPFFTRLLIRVPMPSSVKISIRVAWGTRPSMMWALATPPLTASSAHSTLGIMPP